MFYTFFVLSAPYVGADTIGEQRMAMVPPLAQQAKQNRRRYYAVILVWKIYIPKKKCDSTPEPVQQG